MLLNYLLEIACKEYLDNKVKDKINNGIAIKSFWKDIVKDKKTCFILTIVYDSMKKYIGISLVKIGKAFLVILLWDKSPWYMKNLFNLLLNFI